MLLLLTAQEGDWDELDLAIRRFQSASMALKYAPKPVVAAPFARVFGGGCEWVLHCTRAQASAELYMGLVEVGVGSDTWRGRLQRNDPSASRPAESFRTYRHG